MSEPSDWLPPMTDPERTIRLVRIPERQIGSAGIELNFDLVELDVRLETVPLEDAPSYKALSYTWGCPFSDPKEAASWYGHVAATPAIICNGRRVQVTNSLIAAVRCTNDLEKIVQINLMGEIYSLAAETLVWLAPRVEKYLLFHRYYDKFLSLGDIPLTERKDRDSAITDTFGPATFEARAHMLNEILPFGRLNWWTRIWTLQEFALAESCTLIYGELGFNGKSLLDFLELFVELSRFDQKIARFLRTIFRHNLEFRLKSRHPVMTAQQDPQTLVSTLDNAHGCHNFAAILMEMLGQTVELKTTDPRDAVLGVVGICRVLAKCLKQAVGDHFPPPNPSVTELAAAVAREAVLTVPILTILRFAGSAEEFERVPSWTSDVTRPVYGTLSKQKYDSSLVEGYSKDGCLAGRQFKFFVDLDTSLWQQRLGLEAIKLGVIQSTTAVRHGPEDITSSSNEQEYRTIRAILKFCLSLPEKYWAEHRQDNGLWQTLYSGNSKVTQLIAQVGVMVSLYLYGLDISAEAQNTIFDFFWPRDQEDLVKILGFNVVEDFKAVPVVPESKCDSRAAFLEDLKRKRPLNDTPNCNQWLLAMSEDRIGITTRLSQKDGEICIIRGGEYPFVLRPVDEMPSTFRLIGDAYVDGLMNGELLRERSGSTE